MPCEDNPSHPFDRDAAPVPTRCVVVTGAAGFIGRHVVRELTHLGWSVRALVRPGEPTVAAPSVGSVDVVWGDVRDRGALVRVVSGAAAVVHLAALKSDEPESEATNVGGAKNLVEACRSVGCSRVINVSTQSVKIATKGVYGRTKLAAERVFEESGLAVTVLRPSLVYGEGRSGVFATIDRFVRRLPLVPVLGSGRWVSAPLHVDDVARAITACLKTPATIGRCYDLGGPDLITFDELIDRIAAISGRRRCRKVHIPLALAFASARALKAVWPGAPFTVSNVLGSNQDTHIDSDPARRDFAFAAMSLDEGLRRLARAEEVATLATEARVFARHLLGVDPADAVLRRYVEAVLLRFGLEPDGDVRFVRAHRWSLSLLDAASAVWRPRSQLRRRLLLMAAILEASPAHAEFFLRPPPRLGWLLAGIAVHGLSSVARILCGSVLLPFVRVCHGSRD